MGKFVVVQLKAGWAVQNTETMTIVGTYSSALVARHACQRLNSL
jgi:hypothetical protein